LVEIRHALETKILDVLLTLQTKTNHTFDIPKLEFKQLGRRAGIANRLEYTVTINPDFCLNGHWQQMLDQTLPHEVAHLIAPKLYNPYLHGFDRNKGWGHGRAWKYTMRLLGLQPDRCHDMSTEGVKVRNVRRPYIYSCGCPDKEFAITARMHNRMQSGRWKRCLRCRVRLLYRGERP